MLNPGTILQNRYQIVQHIGGGGMGDVYLANDSHLPNRYVVVKENRGGDPNLFYSEANILANLRHTNLPRVIDHFIEANGSQYLVMDYVAGQTLDQIVKMRGLLSEQVALALFSQVCDAVKYLHRNRVIHRDIKPLNIIITNDGSAVLVDFGIAKVLQTGQVTSYTAHGFVSPGYAPPEQYTGGTDERSDVYGLGASLYFALTGIDPPSAPDRSYGKTLLPVSPRNPSVSQNVEAAIMKAVALQGSLRFTSVEEMELALQGKQTMTTTVAVQSPATGTTPQLTWIFVGVGTGLGIAVIAIVLYFLISTLSNASFASAPTVIPSATVAVAAISPLPILTATKAAGDVSTTVEAQSPTPRIAPVLTATPIPPTSTFTPTPKPPCIAENFASMPKWSSWWDADWGKPAIWQTVGYLSARRPEPGSSAKVITYPAMPNTNYDIQISMNGTSGSGYWTETAYRLGIFSAFDFDSNSSSWTLIKKFESGGTNGTGGTWTAFRSTIYTSSFNSISIGFKAGLDDGTHYGGSRYYPGGNWSNLAICQR